MRYLLFILILCCYSCSKEVYLFTSFHEPANEGLRFLYSSNGYQWKDLGSTFLNPDAGAQKVMRDPSIARGPDGIYHLVWTSSWKGDKGFGYASSRDLVHWSPQKMINVMAQEPEVINVWAPEIFYDEQEKQFIIIWASTIPLRFPKGTEEENNNHRMYYTLTRDFVNFTEAKLFLNPGFSVIDAVIVKRKTGGAPGDKSGMAAGQNSAAVHSQMSLENTEANLIQNAARNREDNYVLVLKDNTRANRNLKVAFSSQLTGPYTGISAPFSGKLTEGPSVVKVKQDWLIYYDAYGEKRYAAYRTRDFKSFTDISAEIDIPAGHKHGTIFKAPRHILKGLLRQADQRLRLTTDAASHK